MKRNYKRMGQEKMRRQPFVVEVILVRLALITQKKINTHKIQCVVVLYITNRNKYIQKSKYTENTHNIHNHYTQKKINKTAPRIITSRIERFLRAFQNNVYF